MALGHPRLVASDVDGTLVHSDGSVSERTVTALRAVERAGVTVVLVTGRPPRWLAPLVEVTGRTGLAICANGALVIDLADGSVVAARPIETAVLADVVGRLEAEFPGLTFAAEYPDGFAREGHYQLTSTGLAVAAQVREAPAAGVDRAALTSRPAVKLLARHALTPPDELLARAREVVGDTVEMTHSSRGGGLLEISAAGVSKATALAELCSAHQIRAEQVIAFGDMPNDLPMLAWAGQPYAMANAHPAVLAAVDLHAPSNDEDGVAIVLERVFRLS